MNHPPKIAVRRLTHRTGIKTIPGVGLAIDDEFNRFGGLTKKKPASPGKSKPRVRSRQRFPDRWPAKDSQKFNDFGMIHRQTKGDVTAAIVANNREAFVTQRPHGRDLIARHRPHRVRRIIKGGRWL